MADGIGRTLWQVYEDAIESLSEQKDEAVASATRNFVDAFEAELKDANLDIIPRPISESKKPSKAKFRSVK